jgi:hypothetical protein
MTTPFWHTPNFVSQTSLDEKNTDTISFLFCSTVVSVSMGCPDRPAPFGGVKIGTRSLVRSEQMIA